MSTDLVKDSNQLKISFNYKYGKVRVYKKVIQTLGTPNFIQFLIKPEEGLLFIVGLKQREHDSFPVVLSEDVKRGGMVLHGQRFVRKITDIVGWPQEGTRIIGGTYISDRNMVAFDLTNVLNDDMSSE